MHIYSILAIGLAVASAAAQTTILPVAGTGAAGTSSNSFPWGTNANTFPGMRIQAIYDSSHFTGAPTPITTPILITNVRWRGNDVATTTTWTGATCSMATMALATAAVDQGVATTNFATNVSPDYMVVHTGPVTMLPGSGNGVGVPGPIVVDIPVNPPFLYDPNLGDFVVDTDFLSGTFSGGSLAGMDTFSTAQLARRVFASSMHPLANGTDTAAPVIEVAFVPAPPGTFASNALIGAGCITVADASSYELFSTSASFDLANSGITMLRSNNGYLALPGASPFIPPSGAATVLALTDNSQAVVTLSQAMPVGRTASTTTLNVCSNGFITMGAAISTTGTPSAATLLSNPRAYWAVNWHDMNPAIVGSGQVKFEQVGNLAIITWDGVWDNSGTSVANANTFQAQFEVTTGSVHYVYGAISTLGNARLVGFSDAGGSLNAGTIDISTLLPSTYNAATFRLEPLTLGPTSRPILGTNWNLSVTDVPPTGTIGLEVFGVSDPAVPDLAILGMPGCGLRASLDVLNVWLPSGPSHAYSLAIPNSAPLIGFQLFTTAVMFEPGANPFGAIISNGVQGTLGDA
ncbi:MAG TPA: hypothetical protein VF384_14490 [Planctomycetota bacterium]